MLRYTILAAHSQRAVQAALACLMLLALLLAGAGCGGSSGSSATPSRFAGTYSGSFVENASPLNIGAITATIDSSGNLTGNTANGGGHGTATLTGSVNSVGNANINVVNSDSTHDSATGAFTFNSAGDLVGAFKNAAGNTITVTVAADSKPLLYSRRLYRQLYPVGRQQPRNCQHNRYDGRSSDGFCAQRHFEHQSDRDGIQRWNYQHHSNQLLWNIGEFGSCGL